MAGKNLSPFLCGLSLNTSSMRRDGSSQVTVETGDPNDADATLLIRQLAPYGAYIRNPVSVCFESYCNPLNL